MEIDLVVRDGESISSLKTMVKKGGKKKELKKIK